MSFIKSPLTYPGAKTWAMDQIMPLIPQFSEYREPFVGGGSVFLSIKQTYPNRTYWINDLYVKLYNFYLQTQQNPIPVVEQVLKWKDEYQDRGRELQQYLKTNSFRFNDIQKAAAYFTWNLTSFSGFGRSFSESNFNKKFNDDRIERLKDISAILQDVKITNLDYEKLIEAPSNGKDIFLFCDPPYFNVYSAELYGDNGNLHRYFDHYRFARLMKDCKYPFLITYDDSSVVRNLFKWATIIPYEFTYTSRRVKTGKEVFITNIDEIVKGIQTKQADILEAWC